MNDKTNNNKEIVVKKQFIVTRKVIMIEYHTVDANSKSEAVRMVDEDEVDDYETHYSEQYNPKFDSILYTYKCPNIHNGWTNVASDVEVGSFKWHYNGMCEGVYQNKDAEMCHECAGALANGYRALTQIELQYLSVTYGIVTSWLHLQDDRYFEEGDVE